MNAGHPPPPRTDSRIDGDARAIPRSACWIPPSPWMAPAAALAESPAARPASASVTRQWRRWRTARRSAARGVPARSKTPNASSPRRPAARARVTLRPWRDGLSRCPPCARSAGRWIRVAPAALSVELANRCISAPAARWRRDRAAAAGAGSMTAASSPRADAELTHARRPTPTGSSSSRRREKARTGIPTPWVVLPNCVHGATSRSARPEPTRRRRGEWSALPDLDRRRALHHRGTSGV